MTDNFYESPQTEASSERLTAPPLTPKLRLVVLYFKFVGRTGLTLIAINIVGLLYFRVTDAPRNPITIHDDVISLALVALVFAAPFTFFRWHLQVADGILRLDPGVRANSKQLAFVDVLVGGALLFFFSAFFKCQLGSLVIAILAAISGIFLGIGGLFSLFTLAAYYGPPHSIAARQTNQPKQGDN